MITKTIGRPPLGCTAELRIAVRPEVRERLLSLAAYQELPLAQVARTFLEGALVEAGELDATEVESWEHRL